MQNPKLKLTGLAGAAVTIAIVLILALSGKDTNVEIIYGVPLDPQGQQSLDQVEKTDAGQHEDLRAEEPPASVDTEQLARDVDNSQEAAKQTTTGPDTLPGDLTNATKSQDGCATRIVRNRSSRNGARPALWVMHYTVSPNRAGWGDVNAIVAYFNNPAAQASSNYVIDNEGHCKLIVPESQKAWTQAYFNPWSTSAEVINSGHEPTYAKKAGLRKIGRVVSDSAKRLGIKLRRAITRGCTIVRAGITDHDRLGCGNFHTDIEPYKLGQVINAARSWRCHKRSTKASKKRCIRRLR